MKTPHRPSLLALALAAAWPVAAQQAAPAAAAAAEDDASQRVVVTASKRLEKQREVAGTVSVLSGADLERRGARDQEDILKLTPGVQFNKGDAGGNTITIRGLGTSTTNEGSGAQQGPTGQYLEDVPLASPIGKGTVYDPLTWDMDRVEILRGPQGVLFGSGSLGGAVRYLFNKPDLAAFGASLKGEYAKAAQGEGAFSVYGMVNAPLQAGTVALRVVAYDRRDPGYIDNLGTKRKDANDLQQRGGRVLLTARPVKGVSATLVASSQKTEQGDTFSVSPDPGRLEHTAPNDSRRSTTTDFYSLTIDADLGGHTLTSITGHWRNKGNNLIDDTELFASVGLPLPQVYRPQTSSQKASSQELRIASNPGGSFSYVAGVFYQTSKLGSRGQQIDPSGAFGITTLVDLTGSGGGTEKAVFADTEFQLGGGWSAGAGGRYYRTTTDSTTTGTQFGAPSNVGPLESSDSGFLPRLSFKYRFGDNMWYGLASKGYRYGGRNGPPTNDEYKSDSLWSYETGVRLSPADGLQVDLALFLLDWKDAQFTFFERIGALPNSRIGNVGKARSTGLEAALKYRASAAVDLAATLAYVDATTKAAVTIPSGGPTSIAVAPGARLPGTPKLQGTLQGNLRFAGPFGSQGRASATYAHTGDRVMFLGGNKPADAYDTLDLGLQFAKGSWTLAAGLANATNEKGVLSITGAPAGVGPFAQYFLQRPRTLSVSLRYDL
ncbi:MAG: TonB-dependent receptor [Pseudomonadota bacterium]|jgi:iron complex outermembrane receptor protein|nr:TonB-dependent receptor [Rubrivivax sp.]MCA3256889.1 TonB-dependent receptor [Rubrivivax sp.]MCE2913237.1 TonB-dependent receptor [Rubrivivax sp.]MCZ8032749.1 TonB-dependent receptor [Rubrivivax sp.]